MLPILSDDDLWADIALQTIPTKRNMLGMSYLRWKRGASIATCLYLLHSGDESDPTDKERKRRARSVGTVPLPYNVRDFASPSNEASDALDALCNEASIPPLEMAILDLTRQGYTQEEIGARLNMPQQTISYRLATIIEKLSENL